MILIWSGQSMRCNCYWKQPGTSVGRVYEAVDWESVKEEYEKKREKFVSNLPQGDEIFLHPASIF